MPTGFPPVCAPDARVLILGTMPSEASLQKGQYYGYGRNAFWPVVYALWDEPYEEDYARRCRFLTGRGIALWDVLAVCERPGSADAAIRNPVPNDFAAFAAAHPRIERLFFNSSNAAVLYERLVKPDPFAGVERDTLPSTSPARAMRFEDKLALWRPVRRFLDENRPKVGEKRPEL